MNMNAVSFFYFIDLSCVLLTIHILQHPGPIICSKLFLQVETETPEMVGIT